MYSATIEVGPAADARKNDSDVCLRVVTATIQLNVMSSAPRFISMHDPKTFSADSLDALMRQISFILKQWGAV